jgi:hypothetical protein
MHAPAPLTDRLSIAKTAQATVPIKVAGADLASAPAKILIYKDFSSKSFVFKDLANRSR